MKCVIRSASEAVGVFRKSGVRSRIQKLRDDIEADPGLFFAFFTYIMLFICLFLADLT